MTKNAKNNKSKIIDVIVPYTTLLLAYEVRATDAYDDDAQRLFRCSFQRSLRGSHVVDGSIRND